jgi:hypothetical protein
MKSKSSCPASGPPPEAAPDTSHGDGGQSLALWGLVVVGETRLSLFRDSGVRAFHRGFLRWRRLSHRGELLKPRAEQGVSLTIARHKYPARHRIGKPYHLRHAYKQIFGADHWVGANMTGKTSKGLHESHLWTETGSIADKIATALCSAEAEAYMQVTGLPLVPLLPPMVAPSLYCVLTPIDDRGRLADRSPIRAVGWPPGQAITISVVQETVIIVSQSNGAERITRQGHLRLPARVRHICRLISGDRLLIAAAPEPGVLVAYTMPSLESILLKHHLSAPRHGATK